MGCLLSERQAKSGSRTSWSDLVGNAVPRHGSINEVNILFFEYLKYLGYKQLFILCYKYRCFIFKIKKKHPDTKIVGVSATNAIQYKFLSSNITG